MGLSLIIYVSFYDRPFAAPLKCVYTLFIAAIGSCRPIGLPQPITAAVSKSIIYRTVKFFFLNINANQKSK